MLNPQNHLAPKKKPRPKSNTTNQGKYWKYLPALKGGQQAFVENEAHHGKPFPAIRGEAAKCKQHKELWGRKDGKPDPSKLGRDPHERGQGKQPEKGT